MIISITRPRWTDPLRIEGSVSDSQRSAEGQSGGEGVTFSTKECSFLAGKSHLWLGNMNKHDRMRTMGPIIFWWKMMMISATNKWWVSCEYNGDLVVNPTCLGWICEFDRRTGILDGLEYKSSPKVRSYRRAIFRWIILQISTLILVAM